MSAKINILQTKIERLLQDKKKYYKRWEEYFEELLNGNKINKGKKK